MQWHILYDILIFITNVHVGYLWYIYIYTSPQFSFKWKILPFFKIVPLCKLLDITSEIKCTPRVHKLYFVFIFFSFRIQVNIYTELRVPCGSENNDVDAWIVSANWNLKGAKVMCEGFNTEPWRVPNWCMKGAKLNLEGC